MFRKLINLLRIMNWRQLLSYFGLFAIFFLVFLYLTFPFDAIKESMINQIESKYDVKVQIQELSPYRMTGVSIKNMVISDSKNAGDVLLRLDKARVRAHILPVLTGAFKADFDLYSFGGGVAGQMIRRSKQTAVSANFKNIDITRMGAEKQLKKYGEIRISGTMDGHAEFFFDDLDKRQNTGLVRLEYNNLRINNSTVIGSKLPDIAFNTPSVIQLSMNNQVLNIDQWNLSSPQLDIKAKGNINLKERLDQSRFNVDLSVKPSEQIEESFGAFAMVLPEPDTQGYYNFAFTGTAKNPSFKKR